MDKLNDEVDDKILNQLLMKIIGMERENLRTERYSITAMVDNILNLIKEKANADT